MKLKLYQVDAFAAMVALQYLRRGGVVGCELAGNRVLLRGQSVTYMQAEIGIEI